MLIYKIKYSNRNSSLNKLTTLINNKINLLLNIQILKKFQKKSNCLKLNKFQLVKYQENL